MQTEPKLNPTPKSKTHAKKYFKKIFNELKTSSSNDLQLYDEATEEFGLFLSVVPNHPLASEKFSKPIVAFSKQKSPSHGTSCLYAHFSDNSVIDFSYLKCLDQKTTPQQCVYKAARSIIRHDVLRAKYKKLDKVSDSAGFFECPYSGSWTLRHDAVAHHMPGFNLLVDNFLTKKKLTRAQVKIIETPDGKLIWKNRNLKEDFRQFHEKNALLVLLSAKQHKRLPKNQCRTLLTTYEKKMSFRCFSRGYDSNGRKTSSAINQLQFDFG